MEPEKKIASLAPGPAPPGGQPSEQAGWALRVRDDCGLSQLIGSPLSSQEHPHPHLTPAPWE